MGRMITCLEPYHDELAESLEARGLYRRAITRWSQVKTCAALTTEEHNWVLMHISELVAKCRRPEVNTQTDVRAVARAATRVLAEMKIDGREELRASTFNGAFRSERDKLRDQIRQQERKQNRLKLIQAAATRRQQEQPHSDLADKTA